MSGGFAKQSGKEYPDPFLFTQNGLDDFLDPLLLGGAQKAQVAWSIREIRVISGICHVCLGSSP